MERDALEVILEHDQGFRHRDLLGREHYRLPVESSGAHFPGTVQRYIDFAEDEITPDQADVQPVSMTDAFWARAQIGRPKFYVDEVTKFPTDNVHGGPRLEYSPEASDIADMDVSFLVWPNTHKHQLYQKALNTSKKHRKTPIYGAICTTQDSNLAQAVESTLGVQEGTQVFLRIKDGEPAFDWYYNSNGDIVGNLYRNLWAQGESRHLSAANNEQYMKTLLTGVAYRNALFDACTTKERRFLELAESKGADDDQEQDIKDAILALRDTVGTKVKVKDITNPNVKDAFGYQSLLSENNFDVVVQTIGSGKRAYEMQQALGAHTTHLGLIPISGHSLSPQDSKADTIHYADKLPNGGFDTPSLKKLRQSDMSHMYIDDTTAHIARGIAGRLDEHGYQMQQFSDTGILGLSMLDKHNVQRLSRLHPGADSLLIEITGGQHRGLGLREKAA